MITRALYRYVKANGEIIVTPNVPGESIDYTVKYRLVAERGMAITNGEIITSCIDVDSVDGWKDCEPDDLTEWVLPTGAQDAYNKGDKVRHNHVIWESLVDGNMSEPGADGTEDLWEHLVGEE